MKNRVYEHTEIYSFPVNPKVGREKMISVKKQMQHMNKNSRKVVKRDTCWICNKPCNSFCRSHSIPRLVLKNISEDSEVSAPRQMDELEPQKNTGIELAGIFFNICNDCDSKYFQAYESECALDSKITDDMLSAIALKNVLKMVYDRSIEVEEEKAMEELMTFPIIVRTQGQTPAEYAVKSLERELKYALEAINTGTQGRYHLYYTKKLNYVVPYAAQYPIAMLTDLTGNVINNFYTGSNAYRLEYLHIGIFPLKETTMILIFGKNGEKRHARFIRQLKKLEESDQLSAINFLTFTGADNVFIHKSTYEKMLLNPIFTAACRLTYSIRSNVPNPSNALEVAMRAHSFQKRFALPNLLDYKYAIPREKLEK